MVKNRRTVALVSLGCPKNLVDSENIVSTLMSNDFRIVTEPKEAEVVIVNTCGFLDSARQESLDAIGEALRENGKVIVTGCLGAEDGLIRKAHPNVLSVTGPQQYEQVVKAVHAAVPPVHDPYVDLVPPQGLKLTPRHFAYLKISEGCNHSCTFCIIPSMRGKLVSRPAGDVLVEAERLALAGVKELLVISQDTSAYGVDIRHAESPWRRKKVRAHMTDLAGALGELGVWVRLHYVYPYPHVDDAIELMAAGKILPYLDIPFQHASPSVLKAMKRPAHGEKTLARVAQWRRDVPDMTVRSTFIVGFPGETEKDFEELLAWLEEAKLDRVGCFKFEPVAGAAANDLPGAVPEALKEERWHRLMAAQKKISAARLKRFVGRELDVLVDHVDAKKRVAVARSKADAPEIDGLVKVKDAGAARVGEFLKVRVDKADAYDLHATAI
ncbi:MAG: 30S ribosomal protein S12 methylthiotransferase RimO [Tagaea sp.]